MSDPIEFHEVSSDEAAKFLMPGSNQKLHLVLFCAPGSPTVRKAREFAAEVDLPAQWQMVHLDPQRAPETTAWFGLSEQAGMAAIFDGSMLAVEYECSLEAFRRLLSTARQQHASLEKLG